MAEPLLSVRDLSVEFRLGGAPLRALHEVSFDVDPGRILGIVGESGSGKSLTAKSIMRMLPDTARAASGEIRLRGRDLLTVPEAEMRRVRGREIAMVFQDPQAALNPVKTVGWQIEEALVVHGMATGEARRRAVELLAQVGIPDPARRAREYPHEFSGGMRQRVVIAIAIANAAPLLIADEPTTALDVTIQAQVLRLLADLRAELGVGVILITHDMGVVAEFCDDVAVMYGGRVVERATVTDLFAAPQHPYTRALLRCMPRLDGATDRRLPMIGGQAPDLTRLPPGCAFHPRCSLAEEVCRNVVPPLERVPDRPANTSACHVALRDGHLPPEPATAEEDLRARAPDQGRGEPLLDLRNVAVDYGHAGGLLRRAKPFFAVDGVSLSVAAGETLGLVGESGCGKSSLARMIVGMAPVARGELRVLGRDVTAFDAAATRHVRRSVQYVFQDPYASLNPRLTVRQLLFEALEMNAIPKGGREGEAVRLMELVGLDPAYLDRYPKAFSGGQRQRIGIARALAVEPDVLICDEPVSALDVSIQAQVINILADLRDRLNLAVVFIAHDLAVVRHLSDRVAVMYLGRIVEEGPADEVYAAPRHPYTATLLSSTPRPDPAARRDQPLLKGDPPDPRNPPSGCRFRTRCPIGPLADPSRRICVEVDPALDGPAEHRAACHFPDELRRPAAAPSHESAE